MEGKIIKAHHIGLNRIKKSLRDKQIKADKEGGKHSKGRKKGKK